MIRRADRTGIAVPMTGSAEPKEGQITGGYVHDVEAGLHPGLRAGLQEHVPQHHDWPQHLLHHAGDPAHPEQPTEKDELHTAPTGVRFWGDEHRTGLVPFLLRDLMAQRDLHKAGMRDAPTDEERAFHDDMQYAVKI